jgi:hypothetical protein
MRTVPSVPPLVGVIVIVIVELSPLTAPVRVV